MAKSRLKLLLIETGPAAMKGSMSRYARLVEKALIELSDFSENFELKTVRLAMPDSLQTWVSRGVGTWLNHFWLMVFGASEVRRLEPDLVHVLDGSYAYLLNRLNGTMVTATVHDLIPLLQQRNVFGPDRTSLLAHWVVQRSAAGLSRCSRFVSVSDNTRRDLVRFAAIDPNSIAVVPIALDPVYTSVWTSSASGPQREARTTAPVVLHVGNNAQYKNRAGVVRIFSRIIQSRDARLKLVGPAPDASLLRLIKELDLEGCVDFTGPVDDSHLCEIYQDASVLLFPSLYEGFGWPPLEAMACGCPVVCSNEGSLTEVTGDAALTAPARDEERLALLCLRLLQDPRIAAELRMKGRQHVRQFTLKRMGEQLLAVYESVLTANPKLRDRARSLAASPGA